MSKQFQGRAVKVFSKKFSTSIDFQIFTAMKSIKASYSEVAKTYQVSAQYVRNLMGKIRRAYRLRLPTVMALDEVYTCLNSKCKYSFAIFNPINPKLVDILPT